MKKSTDDLVHCESCDTYHVPNCAGDCGDDSLREVVAPPPAIQPPLGVGRPVAPDVGRGLDPRVAKVMRVEAAAYRQRAKGYEDRDPQHFRRIIAELKAQAVAIEGLRNKLEALLPISERTKPESDGRCSAPWLFPEIEEEIRADRSAAAREAAQRVREEKRRAIKHLRGRDISWTINHLLEHGPTTECDLMFAVPEYKADLEGWLVILDLWALWRIGKLWRKSKGMHPAAGAETFLYGVRNVHSQNAEL